MWLYAERARLLLVDAEEATYNDLGHCHSLLQISLPGDFNGNSLISIKRMTKEYSMAEIEIKKLTVELKWKKCTCDYLLKACSIHISLSLEIEISGSNRKICGQAQWWMPVIPVIIIIIPVMKQEDLNF